MTLIFNGHSFKYELESIVKLFIPAQSFSILYENKNADGDLCISYRRIGEISTYLSTYVRLKGKQKRVSLRIPSNKENFESECELELARQLFSCLKAITGIVPKWGILTGIRPVKRVNCMISEGKTQSQIEKILIDNFFVDKEKVELAYKTAAIQESLLHDISSNSFSLYVSIPFCPSRCSYCSFVSQSIQNAKHLIPEYIERLCEEIRYTAKISKELGLQLDTVYFGGGTPTAITENQLEKLMETISQSFDLSNLREYTVEAGRADTITQEKLDVIKRNGATRISINPQTLNDDVLKEIGRNHTSHQVIYSYLIARRLNFHSINMDVIAGLPTETLESFKHTIDEIIKLSPENITVHTLSIKRSSDLVNENESVWNNPVSEMISYASKRLAQNGYSPYYLYRQKNMLGNLENTGYSKLGKESLYNVYIMEEAQTILAVGAGASTKLIDFEGKRLERIFNYKLPLEYNKHFDVVLEKKQDILNFFANKI